MPMGILAIECGGDALSLALSTPTGRVDDITLPGGAAVSSQLLPQALALLNRHGLRVVDLQAIAFACGPGSFTGVRTACAVAQGLAWAAGRQRGQALALIAIDSLMIVAEMARRLQGCEDVLVAIDARMGEVYCGHYRCGGDQVWQRNGDVQLLAPAQLQLPPGAVLAGNAMIVHRDSLHAAGPPIDTRLAVAAHASAALALAPALLARGESLAPEDAHPLYVRNRVALTTAERARA